MTRRKPKTEAEILAKIDQELLIHDAVIEQASYRPDVFEWKNQAIWSQLRKIDLQHLKEWILNDD